MLLPEPQEFFFSVSLTIHRLAAKSFIQTKDMGFQETPANDKKDILKISLECGVISSHTAFIAINKDLNKPVQGPLARSDVPSPMLFAQSGMFGAPMMLCSASVPMPGNSAPMFGASVSMSPKRCKGGEFYSNQTHIKQGALYISFKANVYAKSLPSPNPSSLHI